MHRQRFGYAAVFGRSPVVTIKGAAMNRPSQPQGRALTHDVPPLAPC